MHEINIIYVLHQRKAKLYDKNNVGIGSIHRNTIITVKKVWYNNVKSVV